MSTRGWYEYYVLDEITKTMSLSMQFYKWGDAVPLNALHELGEFKKTLQKLEGTLPVFLLDEMLRDQLGAAYQHLPPSFSVGCYLFFLQRAREEQTSFKRYRYAHKPKNENPDYMYAYRIGYVIGRYDLPASDYLDEFVNWANYFVTAGKYVRPWNDYSLKYSLLIWLQCLTQSTREEDMGSIAGDFESPFDISFIYRYFIFVPELDYVQRISEIRLQVCDRHGADLFAGESDNIRKDETGEDDYAAEMLHELREAFDDDKEVPYSLEAAKGAFTWLEPVFWKTGR